MRALIVVDLQNDFVEGGALAVAGGKEIVGLINHLTCQFDLVIATQDWHPADHQSFASQHPKLPVGSKFMLGGTQQTVWPDHCVQGSFGADFVPQFDRSCVSQIFRKGYNRDIDSYSGFFDNNRKQATGLEQYLRDRGVEEVFVVGLATDYCVKFTALDAASLGFKTHLISDACQGVELSPGDIERSIAQMQAAGIVIQQSEQIMSTTTQRETTLDLPDSLELVGHTKHLQLVKRGKWSFVQRPASVRVVCIVALTDDRHLLLVEQHRPPVGCTVIELPAGLAGDIIGHEDEPLLRAAQRELLEETGFVAKRWRELTSVTSSAGITNEVVTMFIATGLTQQTSGGGDSSENIQVSTIPLSQIPQWLTEQQALGKMVDSRVYAGLYFANLIET